MIKAIYSKELTEVSRKIRTEVFVEEQGFKEEFDTIDNDCMHIDLYDKEKAVATARVYKENGEYHLGRVAVLKSQRGQHFGERVVKEAENYLRENGADMLTLSSQVRVRDFYKHLGYIEVGEEYLDEYCPHIKMYKKL